MIIVKFYALSDFIIEDHSRAYSKMLADLFEVNEDEIVFVFVKSNLYHAGNEQTNWNVLIELTLDARYHNLQENVNKFFVQTLGENAVNTTLVFNYTENHHVMVNLSEKYPRYLSKTNSVDIEEPKYDDNDVTDENKVYTGNVFKDFDK